MVRKTQSPSEQPGQTVATQVILLQPKSTTTDEALASLFKGVQSLHKRIPHLLAVSAGENQSTRHRGFTHGILLHFVDEAHLHDALAHQAYLDLQQKIGDLCDQAVTFEISGKAAGHRDTASPASSTFASRAACTKARTVQAANTSTITRI